jgi:hypothetical protein
MGFYVGKLALPYMAAGAPIFYLNNFSEYEFCAVYIPEDSITGVRDASSSNLIIEELRQFSF